MLNYYYKSDDRILRDDNLQKLSEIPHFNLLWFDLKCPTEEEKTFLSELFSISFQNEQQLTEIESSSRFLETEDMIIANSNFFSQGGEHGDVFSNEPVQFILKDNLLISTRQGELRSFSEVSRRMDTIFKPYSSGYHVLVSIFETRVDLDADFIESISKEISRIGKTFTMKNEVNESVIHNITHLQETTMMLRENIIDKQRVVSAMLKSEYFPKECYERLRIIIKDINSLLEHTAFSFERLEYLQNTFLGLINIEQNKIIKIFTVASVIFMPPTLIASIYGMNFKIMPELLWKHGYWFAIGLMICTSVITLWIFRKKRWI